MHDYELELDRDSDDESLESFFEVGRKRVPTVSATVRVPVHGGPAHGHAGHPVPIHRSVPARPASRISGGGRWTRAGSNIVVHGVYAGGGSNQEIGGAEWETEYESESSVVDRFLDCMKEKGLFVKEIFGTLRTIEDIYRVVKWLVRIAEANPELTLADAVAGGFLLPAGEAAVAEDGLTALAVATVTVADLTMIYYATSCARCLAVALGKNWTGGLTLSNAWHALTT